MVESGEPPVEVFALAMDLHQALGEAPVKERVWRYDWMHEGRAFSLKMNGHLAQHVDSLPPLNIVIECDGWPIMACDMFSGEAIGDAEARTVAALMAAIEAAK